MARLEGWRFKINDVADHTFVRCPDNGQVFECWQGSGGPDELLISAGDGNYNVADCYRCPVWPFRDTACIGVYAVHGVCHQSTNCFLFSAGATLDLRVRGYWFSALVYGVWGRLFPLWLGTYAWCSWLRGAALEEVMAGMAAGEQAEDALSDKLRRVHAEAADQGVLYAPAAAAGVRAAAGAEEPQPLSNRVLMDEAATLTQHFAPDVDPASFRDLHASLLEKKDAIVASGLTGTELADALNELSVQTQQAMMKRLGSEDYQKLMGVEAGETLRLIEPDVAEAAGKPVPPPPDKEPGKEPGREPS
jgi:hypothetical protein